MRLIAIIAVLFALTRSAYAEDKPLLLIKQITLPGVTGRIDHMAMDVASNRLFIAALGGDSLEVVDLKHGTLLRSIPGLREPQGVVYIPDSDLVVVSNGESGSCLVFDADTLTLKTHFTLPDDADDLRYDNDAHRLFVAYGRGAIGIFDSHFQQVGNILLPGHPESFVTSANGIRMFVNVPATHAVVVADVGRQKILATWMLKRARGNFPMSMDEAAHLLFVGTRHPSEVTGMDSRSGRVAFTVPIDGDADDMFIDAKRHHIYVSCGSGYLDVLTQSKSGRYALTERIPTAPGARTSLFIPGTGRLLLAVPEQGRHKAEIRVYALQPNI